MKRPKQPHAKTRRRNGVFLTINDVDLKWLEAEARRQEKERLGLEAEPEAARVQPVIYDLIRRARISDGERQAS